MEAVVKHLAADPAALSAVARSLVAFSRFPQVVAFYGEMGAGKTTLIRTLCQQLGVTENVSSPTFSIINEYQGSAGKVFHFDFYRIENPSEAVALGIEEYFESGNWCLVEWPEKILNLLPHHRTEVRITADGDVRHIEFTHV